MSVGTITKDGESLVAAWESTAQRVRDLKADLNRAECEASNATTALGNWMVPKDAKEGEKFSVWHGDRLIEVVCVRFNTYTVGIRRRS